MIRNTEVLTHLANLCHAVETGTFFITTIDNKACHILLEKGQITALSYGKERGEAVISELPFIKIERFSFQQQMKMPLSSRAFVDKSHNSIRMKTVRKGVSVYTVVLRLMKSQAFPK